MLKITLSLLLLTLHSPSYAMVFERLSDCQNSCSQSCNRLISKLENAIGLAKDCGSQTHTRPAIKRRCSYHFETPSLVQECIQYAKSVALVDICAHHFELGPRGTKCLRLADSVSQVNYCADKYGIGQAGINCLR